MALTLPPALTAPIVLDGRVLARLRLDLTVYLKAPSEEELEALIRIYESVCPKGRLVKYAIAELPGWFDIARPVLTDSGKVAAAAAKRHPYFEPSRRRLRDGRAFVVGLWDGRPIEDPTGDWDFNCRALLVRETGRHAFARIVVPLETDPNLLLQLAVTIADTVQIDFGHGGLTLAYDPRVIGAAFDGIYALTRRFWGVDVEYLTATLPIAKQGIKSVNWLTILGRERMNASGVETELGSVSSAGVVVDPRRNAVLFVAGPQPVAGDQNHPDTTLKPYVAVAKALERLFLKDHPDFPGNKFVNNGNTVGWMRRFLEPKGWR